MIKGHKNKGDSENKLNSQAKMFGFAGNNAGRLGDIEKINLASSILYQWFNLVFWRQKVHNYSDVCTDPCCAPVSMSTTILPEIAMTILGMPLSSQEETVDTLCATSLEYCNEFIENEKQLPDPEDLKNFTDSVCGEALKTAKKIRKINQLGGMGSDLSDVERN